MSFGLIGDGVDTFGPTIQGLKALRESIEKDTSVQELWVFITIGISTNPAQLVKDCKDAIPKADNDIVKSILKNLGDAASKCKKRIELC
jgi:hypothetical protein